MAGHNKRQSFSFNPAQSAESAFSIISGKHDFRGLKNVHEESFYILGRASSFQSEQESIKSGDEVEDGPYGRFYEEITLKHLKEISHELGLITLTWPEIASPDYEQRKHFPPSYSVNSKKEKLLLLYAENFRRQYHYAYIFRKPLFLAADNECGLQKMVCTTIRPTTMHYAEFYTWQGCAQFICDHIIYEPLEKITLVPERVRSPHTVLSKQKGNCFEVSILLCSYLVAAGYKAYVVSGYASMELCTNDRSRVACPLLEPDREVELVTKEEAPPKYVVHPPRDLQSKFLQEMKMREVRKILEEERRLAEEEQRDKDEYEAPQLDDYYGFRIHSWVVVLPGARDVTEPFFLEPASGVRYDISYQHYFRLESIWNNTNYWVNLQSSAEGCAGLQFKLSDVKCWEHLLPGEPWHERKAVRSKVDPAELVLQEKHLDIPESWVSRLDVSNPTYEMRYPGGSKVTHYKKSILEQFAPYLQREGLVTRLTEYDDLDYMHPRLVHEHYLNCSDKLARVTKNLKTEVVREEFHRGREDALKVHTCIQRDCTVEHERTLEFYSEARHDGLEKLLMHPLFMTEYFSGREDCLCYRHVDFAPRGRGPVEPRRTVLKLLEKFNRNPAKEACDDIAQQVFALADNEILIKYHYEEGKVTAATREFVKPPAAELGERLTFNPALTCSYQTDATVPRPNQLSLFLLLEELLVTEDKSLYHVRDMEDEVGTILKTRASEMRFPRLLVSIFDKERNDSNKRSLKERGEMLRAKKIRETQSNVDYLAPYLARIGNPQLLQQRQALEVREVCLADYKQLLIDRANRMQKQFEAESVPLQEKHRWYEEVQDTLTREEEEEYFEYNNRVTFRLHALELRLNRHRELAAQRYLAVEACLRADPRLVILLW